MPKRRKVLIVKLGYSETLVDDTGQVCSLGDVLRTTVLLHPLKNDRVTWLTDKMAIPLLENNPYIHSLLPFNLLTTLQLLREIFDVVINLEKNSGICSLVEMIPANRHYGFRFEQDTGKAMTSDRRHNGLVITSREDLSKLNGHTWEQTLFSILGEQWNGESYILGYKPTGGIKYDIGFNTHVGPKFPVKAWPAHHWETLAKMIGDKYTISRQQHLTNLKRYIDWIHSCRLLISNDSLGLHLGIALGKKVIALFGPTSPAEFSPQKRLHMMIPPIARECIPCYKRECAYNETCMDLIRPEDVCDIVRNGNID